MAEKIKKQPLEDEQLDQVAGGKDQPKKDPKKLATE